MRIRRRPGSRHDLSGLVWDRIDDYRILGTSVRFQSQDAEIGRRLNQLWAPFEIPSTAARSLDTFALTVGDGGELALLHDCVQVARPRDSSHVLRAACAEINRHAISRYRGLGFHAGVVAPGDTATVFPGESGAGKTTLVVAATTVGFQYVSDEALCLDPEAFVVVPYPKPAALGPWTAERLGVAMPDGEAILGADAFSPVGLDDAMEVANVVSFRRRTGPPTLSALPRSTSVVALLGNSFNHYKSPAVSFRAVSQIAARSDSWLLEYDHAFHAAELLSERLLR
jgi:hypothetical protein